MIAINMQDESIPLASRELRRRILVLINNHPEILKMPAEKLTSVILLDFPEFQFLDINPSFQQMCWAFHSAVQLSLKDSEKP